MGQADWAPTLFAVATIVALVLGSTGGASPLPPLGDLVDAAVDASRVGSAEGDDLAALQLDAVVAITAMADRRWQDLRQTVKTDGCRDEFEKGFAQATVGLLSQTPLPPVPSQCPDKAAPDAAQDEIPPEDLRICYFLLVHKNAAAVERLLDALDHPNHSFVVHVDAKATELRLRPRPNLHVLQDRVSVSWGGFSIVNATLKGMAAAAALPEPWHFFIDVSESDYPIKSDAQIRAKLANDTSTSFLQKWDPDSAARHASKVIVECDGQLNEAGQWVDKPGGMSVTKGSQWFVAERAFVDWVASDQETVPALVQQAKYWTIPDEGFFQTLHDHSPYCARNTNEAQWFLEFPPKHIKGCNNRTSTFCGRSPKILQEEDLAALQMSPKLFARKLDGTDAAFPVQTAIESWRGAEVADDPDTRTRVRFQSRRRPDKCLRADVEGTTGKLKLGSCEDETSEFLLGPCSDGEVTVNQHDCLESVGPAAYPAARTLCAIRTATNPDVCMDLFAGKMEPGAKVGLWECSLAFNQMWRFDGDSCRIARMSYEIPSGLCLEFGDPAEAATTRDYDVADEEPFIQWCNSTVTRHSFHAEIVS